MKKYRPYVIWIVLLVGVIVIESTYLVNHYKKLLRSKTLQIEQLESKLKEKEVLQAEFEDRIKKLEDVLSKERRLRVKLEEATALAKKLIAATIEKEEEIKKLKSQIRDLEVKVYDLEKLFAEEHALRIQLEKELFPERKTIEGEDKRKEEIEPPPVLPEEKIIKPEKK